MHNEHEQLIDLSNNFSTGMSMALISDAGTPAISDPGFLLVRACLRAGVNVTSLPGPTAFVPALVQSGFPQIALFLKVFYLIKRSNSRLSQLAEETRTIVLYESPHRILKTLAQCAQVMGPNRQASISRVDQSFWGNCTRDIRRTRSTFSSHTPKGEFVLVIQGKKTDMRWLVQPNPNQETVQSRQSIERTIGCCATLGAKRRYHF
ncbi:MAG: hypothetical protein CM15mP83_0260 [Flavobacteriaceae bacterium]|nr:MAG: hypothetical protein CM15mP83_0260 [Flavobacteriaceae bacterium]